jgi:hypothetical protein
MRSEKAMPLQITEGAKKALGVFICFAFFLVLYGVTSRADIQVTDEAASFATGISLAVRGNPAIDNMAWLKKIYDIGQFGNGNHLYSRYFPGNSLASAIIYRLTARKNDLPFIWGNPEWGFHEMADSQQGARLALRLNALLGAFGLVMFLLLLKKYYPWKTVIITVLLFGLCTDWWYQSRGFFLEVGAGAFLMAVIYFADDEKPYLCGLMLAISLLFRPTNILALPVWGYAVWKQGWKSIWSFGLILGGLGFLAFYNLIRFQSPLNFGYGSEGFTSSPLVGLVGVLFSPGRSIFIYSPITILAITGGRLLFKRDRVKFLILLVPLAGYILMVALWHNWDGGSSWGSRLLTPVLPVLGVLLAPAIHRSFSRSGSVSSLVVLLLGTIGFGIQVLTITRDPILVLVDFVGKGYATYTDSVISFNKNWLALQVKNLTQWKLCDLDAYTLRNLLARCK